MSRSEAFLAVLSFTVILASALTVRVMHFDGSPSSAAEGDGATADVHRPDIRIAVLNGCGRAGLASMFADIARKRGLDVVNGMGDNADSFEFDVSVVVDRKGVHDKVEIVAERLGISRIIEQRTDNPYALEEIQVIIGRDWDTLKNRQGDGHE